MAYPDRPQCSIFPRDTSHLGGPAVGKDAILGAVSDIFAEQVVNGAVSKRSQRDLNTLCYSARFAGSVDTEVYEGVLEEVSLNVDCASCDQRRGDII